MDILQIKLFGRVQISCDNWKTELNITHVTQGLLAYLLLQRHRTHTRDSLATLFWGEQDDERARGCLNTTLWRLRSALEPTSIAPGTYLTGNRLGEVGFNSTSRYWLDIAVFEEQIKKILTIPFHVVNEIKVQKLMSVMQLYRGDLLEGFYNDWALRERERLRTLYLNCLAYLMKYERYHGAYEKGLAHGQKILELDPLREEIHRELMRLYFENDQRPLAVRQYKACCEMLKAELDIEPMPETQALYAQIILSDEARHIEHNQGTPDHLQETLQDLKQAVQSVEQMHGRLRQAIGSIEAYIKDGPRLPRV
jgi:DNA-binding SARP family transcriptional activator